MSKMCLAQTDHMLTINWSATNGWDAPCIKPCKYPPFLYYQITNPIFTLDGPIPLEPSATVLHYAQTLFEGMKAYRDENGKVTLFRPDMNMKRMNNSATRIALPVRR